MCNTLNRICVCKYTVNVVYYWAENKLNPLIRINKRLYTKRVYRPENKHVAPYPFILPITAFPFSFLSTICISYMAQMIFL